MLTPGRRRADAIKACFMLAGFMTSARCRTPLAKRVTAPATTGDATLVPDNDRQPPVEKKIFNVKFIQDTITIICQITAIFVI